MLNILANWFSAWKMPFLKVISTSASGSVLDRFLQHIPALNKLYNKKKSLKIKKKKRENVVTAKSYNN